MVPTVGIGVSIVSADVSNLEQRAVSLHENSQQRLAVERRAIGDRRPHTLRQRNRAPTDRVEVCGIISFQIQIHRI